MSDMTEIQNEEAEDKTKGNLRKWVFIFCLLPVSFCLLWIVSYDFREWVVCNTVMSHKNNCIGSNKQFPLVEWRDNG